MAAKRLPNKLEISKTLSGKARAARKPSSKPLDSKSDKSVVVKNGPGGTHGATTKTAKSRIPNAVSRKALADLKAGRVTRYADVDDLFDKLGITVNRVRWTEAALRADRRRTQRGSPPPGRRRIPPAWRRGASSSDRRRTSRRPWRPGSRPSRLRRQPSGRAGPPTLAAAIRKTWGSGLPRVMSSSDAIAANRPSSPHSLTLSSRFASGPLEPIASLTPRSVSASSSSRMPSSSRMHPAQHRGSILP